MNRFTNKSIVITGGSSGIGLATARRIVNEGGRVLVTGRDPGRLERVRSQVPGVETLVNNAADPAEAVMLAAEAKRLFGSIDGAFFNAGAGAASPLGQITPELYRAQYDLNVAGPLFGVQAVAPAMRDGGAILITGSVAKDEGFVGGSLYAGTKGAVRAMVRSLARELAPRGIRVNCLSPGPTETEFFNRLNMPAEQIVAIRDHIRSINPLGRLGSAEEQAAIAALLLSSEASFVTGSDFVADGGEVQL